MAKTLYEIIEECKSGQKPDIDDARMAICALDALLTFESTSLMRLAQKESEGKPPGIMFSAARNWEESFNRVKRAMAKPPIDWLGLDHNPDNPECQQRRARSMKIYEKLLARVKEKEDGKT